MVIQSTPQSAIIVDRSLVREIAVSASVHEHSVEKRLRGEKVRGLAADRVDRALRARGIEPGALAPTVQDGAPR